MNQNNEMETQADENIDMTEINEQTEIDRLRLELDQSKDRALRALADLENYRARANRQMADERKYAAMELLRDLLGVWDNLGRSLEAAEKTRHFEALIEGVKLVNEQFYEVLLKNHCEKISAMGQPFDPNVHESVAQMPSDTVPPNHILHEIQSGFKLYDRVVRPSQVVLAANEPPVVADGA